MRTLLAASLSLTLWSCVPAPSSEVVIDLSGLRKAGLSFGPLDRVEVVVTAADLASPIVAAVDVEADTFALSLAPGKARTFTLRALRVDGQIGVDVPAYWGTTTVDLSPGDFDVVIPAYAVGMLKGRVSVPDGVELPASFHLQVQTSRALPGLPQSFATEVQDATFFAVAPVGPVQVNGTLEIGGQTFVLVAPVSVTLSQGELLIAQYALSPVVSDISVAPLYPTFGAALNSWVRTGQDASCPGDDGTPCEHGGERLAVTVPTLNACAGWTVTDTLDVFDWTCEGREGHVRFVSRFKPERGITDLLDFTQPSGPALLPNSVRLDNGLTSAVSEPAVWWSNAVVVVDEAGGASAAAMEPGTITVYASASGTIATTVAPSQNGCIVIVAPPTQLVGQNGTEPTAAVRVSPERRFTWVEGRLRGAAGAPAVDMAGAFHTLRRFTITSESESWGVYLYNGHDNSIIGGKVLDPGWLGFDIVSAPRTTIKHVTVEGAMSDGILLGGYSPDSLIEDVHVLYNESTGLIVESAGARVARVVALGNAFNGVEQGWVDDNVFEDIVAIANGAEGMRLNGDRSVVRRAYVAANSFSGMAASREGYMTITVEHVVAHNNGMIEPGPGVILSGILNSRVVDVTSTGNGGGGVWLYGANNVMSNVTLANNSGPGLLLDYDTYYNVFIGVVSAGNDVGIDFSDSANNTFFRVAVVDNAKEVDTMQSFGNTFNDLFWSGAGACDDAPEGLGVDCAPTEGDATHQGNVSAAALFVLDVNDDPKNTLDGSASTAQEALMDDAMMWGAFASPYRAWGNAAASSTFPSLFVRGACQESCRVYDWRARLRSGAEVVLAGATPSASLLYTHAWDAGSALNEAMCQEVVPGSEWDGESCSSRLLVGAVEVSGDGIGNDDGLCTADEACLVSQNLGSYQGEGARVPVTSTVSGISLSVYETQGLPRALSGAAQ